MTSAALAELLPLTDPPDAPVREVLTPRPRRRPAARAQRHPSWLWAILLAAVLLAIPLGAASNDPSTAVAASGTGVIDDGPFDAEWPMQVEVRVANSERSGPLVDLSDGSLALGGPNGGRLASGVRLPVSGPGYYTYNPATPANYDRALTQRVVDRLVAQGASLVLIGPNLDLTGPSGVVVRWPAHDDHLHVRFPDPDGTGN